MTVGSVLAWAGLVLAAFLIGSLNPATGVARLLGKDLSTSGSGNPGATNAGRVLGRKWGVLVGILDVLKGLVPTLVAGHLLGAHAAYAVGIAAVLGHIWSPFLRGRGGKGVATTLGAILGVHPWVALVVVVVFVVAVALTRWVAAGSIFGALSMLVVAVLVWTGHAPGDAWTGWWLTAIGLLVLWRHQNNVIGWWRQRRIEHLDDTEDTEDTEEQSEQEEQGGEPDREREQG
ncbi:glycerol-3-phosphate 1-O-acyltransferase PlsY [Intrasporangium sp. YIM S08009]|uniref:glycerol-3-phosphate 1-O-acyltransferase PlsY n=1 Tax=Intrasporangium zincisolvens TaxID=3080018 RepID=UPI002B0585D2|nr:glycerol-3-phosphate 1-O-acyltransferase PlsY [Intrasporangium sp. YIM S08009]